MSALRDALRDLSGDVFFDLLESDDAYLLVLDVPGATGETTDVSVENGRIEVEARRAKDVGDYRYLEENRSLFLEVDLPLPSDASETGVETAVERGVLEVTMPKRGDGETTIDIVDGGSEGGDDAGTDDAGDAEPR
ncbi:Hsp20/alpha crystallin family protein [Natrialbaceae archaeon GCM10025810]|uniref:Hsp20/alpha crystallin family protein n=1 Tax=Halovalidus salilacus TaxID=3075124 RepID=UPI00360F2D17